MYYNIDGLRIHCETRGEGAPVLLLHGWAASVEAMRPVADAVAGMGMRAVSFDFPGFGKSDEPKEPWGVPEYAQMTRKFIEELGLYGCELVCHSFGGRIAIYLASEDKKIFNRMVLVDAAGIRPKRTLKWYAKTGAYKLGKQLKRISIIDKAFDLSKRQAEAGSEDYRALSSDIMRAVFVRTVNLDLSPRLGKISNPTLLIWGENDDSTPLYMGKLMESRIQDSGLVVLKGAGHFSYIDQYARFSAVLRAFFRPYTINCEGNK